MASSAYAGHAAAPTPPLCGDIGADGGRAPTSPLWCGRAAPSARAGRSAALANAAPPFWGRRRAWRGTPCGDICKTKRPPGDAHNGRLKMAKTTSRSWLPIATAPRSELAGQILTFLDYGGLEESYPVFRGKSGPWFQTSFWSSRLSLWVGWPLNVQPTHWMPLPAGPCSAMPARGLACNACPRPPPVAASAHSAGAPGPPVGR